MVKDVYKHVQVTDLQKEIKAHDSHLKQLEARLYTLEAEIPLLKKDIDEIVDKQVRLVVKQETKDIVKEVRSKSNDQLMQRVNEELERVKIQIDEVENKIETKVADYRTLSENILKQKKDRKSFDLTDSVYSTMGIICYGPVGQLQKFLDDLEMIYQLNLVYYKTCQPPNKLEISLIRKDGI